MSTRQNKKVVHERKRRPSLRQLADKIGVSHTAVRRALSNDPLLSKELRERIHELAAREGYLASDTTQGLISGQTGMIGVILPRLAASYVDDIAEGISEALWDHDAIPLILCSRHDVKVEEKMIAALARKRVSGLIVMPCREDRDESHFAQVLSQHTPIVAVDTPFPKIQAPLVATDNHEGGVQATQHLIDLGHQHIVHLSGVMDNESVDQGRALAYEQTMHAAGLKPRVIYSPTRRFTLDAIIPVLKTFFDSTEGRKTTAVFAFSDPHAYCVYQFARSRGMTIGKDLAVAGFGHVYTFPKGLPEATSVLSPTLTTVDQFPKDLGKTAVKVMLAMIAGEPVSQQTLVKPRLIVGASTAGCPTNG